MFTGKKTGIVISGADTIEVRFGDEMEFDDLEQESHVYCMKMKYMRGI